MNSNWSYSPETPNLDLNGQFFAPYDLEIWRMTLNNNRAPLLCYFKLCASFYSHRWIQTLVTIRKRPIWGQNQLFFALCDPDIWWMTLKNNRAPLLCYFKLCQNFWVKIGDFFSRVTLTFDLWPWSFAWISLLSMVITPENFMMIRWQEHCEKRVTDGQTDGQTERSVLRAAWSQLKTCNTSFICYFLRQR